MARSVAEELAVATEVDIITEEVSEVLAPNISEVEATARALLEAKREAATRRKTSRRAVQTSIKLATNQAAVTRERRAIRYMKLMIREMLGRRAVRSRRVSTATRRVRRRDTTMKQNSTASTNRVLRATREPATARRAATRRDTRPLATTTCTIRTNSRRNTHFTMTPTRVGTTANTVGSKSNNQLLREVMRRVATLMPLIMKVNMGRRVNSKRDNITAKRRDIRAKKVIKDITIIMKISPKRVAILKGLHMATAVVMVILEAMVVAMVAATAIIELPQYWISRFCTQIYPKIHMESKCCVCICLAIVLSTVVVNTIFWLTCFELHEIIIMVVMYALICHASVSFSLYSLCTAIYKIIHIRILEYQIDGDTVKIKTRM
jgi:hypothetical protein